MKISLDRLWRWEYWRGMGRLDRLDIFLHGDDILLKRIEAKIDQLLVKETQMGLSLDALTQAVNDEKGVEDSVIVLLGGLSAKIQELITASGNTVDPAALQAIVDSINVNKTTLAAAAAANPVP